MEWELSKENVMPVKTGHNVETINEALKAKADGSARSNVIEDQRRQLLQAIQDYAGEDPLDPWMSYIKWIKDAYPAGGAQSHLLKVLEECTRKFQNDERYRCDRRYLHTWISYADCSSDPSDIFAFLEKKNIGQDHALFYEAYATSMEIRRKFAKAESIYHLGIQRSAQPLARLENQYKNFLHRMNGRFERNRQEQLQMGMNENDGSQMRHFGNTTSSSGLGVGLQTQRPRPLNTSTRRHERPGLQICVDPELASTNPFQNFGMKENQAASHEQLGSDADRRKENVQQPARWTKAKISQNINAQAAPRPDLDVFVDEEFSEFADEANHKSRNPGSKNNLQGLSIRLEDMQKIKRHSPSLKGSFLSLQETWGSSTAEVSRKPIPEISKLPVTVATARGPKRDAVFGHESSIVCDEGHEQSFEEARLSFWLENLSSHVTEKQEDAQAGKNEAIQSSLYSKETIEAPFLESNAHSFGGTLDNRRAELNNGCDDAPQRQTIVNDLNCPSETASMKTLAASQRQTDAIHISFPASAKAVSIDVTPSNILAIQGEETVAIKQFVEQAIVLGSDPAVQNFDAVGHQGLVEPTITTKEALADILDMFNKPLVCNNPRSKSRKLNDAKRVSSEAAIPSGDFEIFVDEDLELRSPDSRSKTKAQKNQGRHSGDKCVQSIDLHASADKHLNSKEAAQNFKNAPRESLQEPTVQSHYFFAYGDDGLGAQSKEVLRTTLKAANPSDIDDSRVTLAKIDGEDALLSGIQASNIEKQRSRTTNNASISANDAGSFQIFVDENFRGPMEPTQSSNGNSTAAAVSVGDRGALRRSRELLLASERQIKSSPGLTSQDTEKEWDGTHFVKPERSPINGDTLVPEKGTSPGLKGRSHGRRPVSKSLAPGVIRRSPRLQVDPRSASPHKEQVPTPHEFAVSNPWDEEHDQKFLLKLQRDISFFEGFEDCKRKYNGLIPLSSLRGNHVRDKVLKLGASQYHLKRCIGQGAFAQVFEAEDEDDDLLGFASKLALKFQKPACPWEFYIYRQLDIRIPSKLRPNYGQVRKFYQYSDCSFMVCNQYDAGTLQDVVNAYLAKSQKMDEILCMFYTIEMLRMLESLHKSGIIHGDFKPDNLMIRDDSNEIQEWTPARVDGWDSKGLALIDFGRSIDTTLYPKDMEFQGDCRTDSFRCPEMYENLPWTFQVDTFGLCVVAHCLLHGTYMQIEKYQASNGRSRYRPKSTYKRFWQVELWRLFFETLINIDNPKDHTVLSMLRRKFEDHLSENNLGKKLRALLAKQTIMMYKGYH